jgi:hypothetical protein
VIRDSRPSDVSADPQAMLVALGEGFFADDSWLQGCEKVQPEEIPLRARRLLVHNRHMTATLHAHYGQPVQLRVLSHREEGANYRRKILLTVDAGARVVEFGIVRLNLEALPAAARKEVEARNLPLGEIFARYDILTRVEPRKYLHFSSPSPIVQYFAPQPPGEAYGRLGVIHCDGQPAVELLEVVPA